MPYSQACFSSYLHQFLPPKCRRQDRLHQHSDLISTMAKPLLRHWPWKLHSYHHLISVFAMLTFLPLDHGHPKMFLWPVSDPYYYWPIFNLNLIFLNSVCLPRFHQRFPETFHQFGQYSVVPLGFDLPFQVALIRNITSCLFVYVNQANYWYCFQLLHNLHLTQSSLVPANA